MSDDNKIRFCPTCGKPMVEYWLGWRCEDEAAHAIDAFARALQNSLPKAEELNQHIVALGIAVGRVVDRQVDAGAMLGALGAISAHPDFIQWQKTYQRNKRRKRRQERKWHGR